MTAKEYLSQAHRLDQRIDAKIAQVASLNDLATKCSATLTGMPRNPNHGSDKPNGAEARSSEELKFLSSQATLSYRVAVATDAISRRPEGRGLAGLAESLQTVLCYSFFNAFGQRKAETGQRNGGAGTCKLCNGLIQAHCAQNNTGNHITHQYAGWGKPGFIDKNLSNET